MVASLSFETRFKLIVEIPVGTRSNEGSAPFARGGRHVPLRSYVHEVPRQEAVRIARNAAATIRHASVHRRIRDYVVLARAVDKGRAELNGTSGSYHFACPLDQTLFSFKGVSDADF